MIAQPKPYVVLLEPSSAFRLKNIDHASLEVRVVLFLLHVDVADRE